MIKAIVTVGTSLFTNYLKNNKSFLNEYERLIDEPYSNYGSFSHEVNKIKSDLDKKAKDIDLSAEIKTLVKLKEELSEKIEVYLFSTDTILSKLASEIIKAKYNDEFDFREIKVIEGLQTKDFTKYDSIGFLRLVGAFKKFIQTISDEKCETYLLISGGYKAIIPPLTILGQLYNMKLVYVYEESEELIYFPKLPIHYDWSLAEQYYPFLQLIAQGRKLDNNEILEEMSELHLLRKSNHNFKLTSLGQLFKEYIESELPIADNTLGFFVEYKLLEHFLKNPYKKCFNPISHSEKISFQNEQREIDLILEDGIDNKIIIESKSFLQFFRENDLDKLKKQVAAQINIIVNGNFNVKEYHLIIHHTHFFKFSIINENLLEIKKLVENNDSNIQFKAFSLKINIDLKNRSYFKNPYQKFLALPIELKEIKL